MMDTFLASDHAFFLAINHLPHTAILDMIALTLSGIGKVGLVWFVIAVLLFYREEKKHPLFFAPILMAGGVSYVLVEFILKPLFHRIRPSAELGAILVGSPKVDYSFPSGHATIAFAMAIVLSRYEPRWRGLFYTLATLISLSRIYLGVHYPLDVLGGVLLGWGLGRAVRRFMV